MRYEYNYIRCDMNSVQGVLDHWAPAGWRVHTFNRNTNGTTIDILLERAK